MDFNDFRQGLAEIVKADQEQQFQSLQPPVQQPYVYRPLPVPQQPVVYQPQPSQVLRPEYYSPNSASQVQPPVVTDQPYIYRPPPIPPQPVVYQPQPSQALRPGYYSQIAAETAQERKMRLSKPIIITELPDEFKNLTLPMDVDYRPTTYDFFDDRMIGRPGIVLPRLCDEEVAILGRIVMPMLSNGFNRRGAAAVFVLAYHLKPQDSLFGEGYVFDDVTSLGTIDDRVYFDFSTDAMVEVTRFPNLSPTSNVRLEAAVYSFVATSLMRLFTKPARIYVNAWKHILLGFKTFYGKTVDVNLPPPNETAIECLRNWFLLEPRTKMTLYRLLYVGNGRDPTLGIKKFLYDDHICHSGLHIISILMRLCAATRTAPGLILTLINERSTKLQDKCFVNVLKLMASEDPRCFRKMWKYGRIYDDTFMADIQTKACAKLAYVLASALKQAQPGKHDNILQIVQFADLGLEYRVDGDIAATKLLREIRTNHVNS